MTTPPSAPATAVALAEGGMLPTDAGGAVAGHETEPALSETTDGAPAVSRIGRFEVTGKLGEGGMGIVYLARDPDLGRTVAIKLLRGGSSTHSARLQREAQALATLSHPNVVTVYEVGTERDQLYLAMEHVRGVTLRRFIEQHKGEVPLLLDVFRQVALGLAAAHEAHIVHRDFKPDNVLVGDDGRPRIVDFGLAGLDAGQPRREAVPPSGSALATSLTESGALLGTPRYMAPEQFLGEPADARSDQFAFCIALCVALFGRFPFEGDTIWAVQNAVLGQPPNVPTARNVSRTITRAIVRGLSRRPDDRFASMAPLTDVLTRRSSTTARMLVAIVVAAAAAAVIAWSLRDATVRPGSADRAFGGLTQAGDSVPPTRPRARQVTRADDDVTLFDFTISQDGTATAWYGQHFDEHFVTIASTGGGAERSIRAVDSVSPVRFTRAGDALMFVELTTRFELTAIATADGSRRTVRPLPPLDDLGHVLAIDDDGNVVTVFDATSNTIRKLSASGANQRIAGVSGMVIALAWSPDAKRVAWIEGDGTSHARIFVADAASQTRSELIDDTRLQGAACATALVFSDDEHLVYALNESPEGLISGQLWERRLDPTRTVFVEPALALTDLQPGAACRASVSADGSKIAFLRRSGRAAIRVAQLDGDGRLGSPRSPTSDGAGTIVLGWTSDSQRLVLLSERSGEWAFYTHDLATEARTRLAPASSRSARMLAHDGEGLLLLDRPASGTEPATLIRIAPDGSVRELGHVALPAWRSDISCARGRCTAAVLEGSIVVVRELDEFGVLGHELARIEASRDTAVAWAMASDASRGALSTWTDKLHVVPLDGGLPMELSLAGGPPRGEVPSLQGVAWAPGDAALIVTGAQLDGAFGIARVRLDGSYEIVHTEPTRWITSPAVAPDGRQLAFGTETHASQGWLLER